MNNSVIAIQSFMIYYNIYALLAPVFFEMNNAFGEEKNILLMIIMIRRHLVNKL